MRKTPNPDLCSGINKMPQKIHFKNLSQKRIFLILLIIFCFFHSECWDFVSKSMFSEAHSKN